MGGYVAFAMLRRAAARVAGWCCRTRAPAPTRDEATRRPRPHDRRSSAREGVAGDRARDGAEAARRDDAARAAGSRRGARRLIVMNSAEGDRARRSARSRRVRTRRRCCRRSAVRRSSSPATRTRSFPLAEAEAMHARDSRLLARRAAASSGICRIWRTGLFSTVSRHVGDRPRGLAPIRAKLWKTGPSPMDLQLTDKVAIVTGSSRGLGLAVGARAGRGGRRVVLCARGADALERGRRGARIGGGPGAAVLAVAADVSTAAGAATVVDADARDVRPPRHPGQQRRQGRRRRHRRRRPTRSGRARSIRRSFPRSACRASPCRTCDAPAAASS